MNAGRKEYKKAARAKAAAWLRQRKRCKTAIERKALKIGLKDSVSFWKRSLSGLDAEEAGMQKAAYRAFLLRKNLIPVLIGAAAVILAALLIVLL